MKRIGSILSVFIVIGSCTSGPVEDQDTGKVDESGSDSLEEMITYRDTIFNHLLANQFFTVHIDTFPATYKEFQPVYTAKRDLAPAEIVERTVISDSVHYLQHEADMDDEVLLDFTIDTLHWPEPLKTELTTPANDILGVQLLSARQGLSTTNVRSVQSDSQDRLWLGTDGGLSLFDGEFLWNITEEQGLPFQMCWEVFVDSKDVVWIGGSVGEYEYIARLEGNTITSYEGFRGMSFAEDNEGNIWIGSDQGILIYEEEGKFKQIFNNYIGGRVFDIQVEKDESWICSDSGLVKIEDGKYFALQGHNGQRPFRYSRKAPDGSRWFVIPGWGLYHLEGEQMTWHFQDNFRKGVYSLNFDRTGAMWLGSWGAGLIKMDQDNVQSFKRDAGIYGEFIWDAIQIPNTDIIALCSMDGLMLFDPNLIRYHTPVESGFMIVDRNENGDAWATEFLGPISLYKNDSVYTISDIGGLVPNHGDAMYTEGGNAWLFWHYFSKTQADGLAYVDDRSARLYNYHPGITDGINSMNALSADGEDLWMYGYADRHLIRLTKDQWLVYQLIPKEFETEADDQSMFPAAIGKDGTVYLKGSSLMGELKGDQLKLIHQPDFDPGEVQSLKYTDNGELLALTKENEIYERLGDRFEFVRSLDIFPEDIWVSQFDKESAICVGNSSVYLLQGDVIEEISQHNNYNGIEVWAAKLNPDSTLWMGSENALIEYSLRQHYRRKQIPFLRIVQLEINQRNLTQSWYEDSLQDEISANFEGMRGVPDQLELSSSFDQVTFHFSASDWNCPTGMRYSYKLEGSNIDWTVPSEETKAVLNNLGAGSYTLRVKAVNANGIWSDELSYSFKLLPPWWRTWWAYLAYLLIVAAAVRAIIKMREKKLLQRQEELENTVAERTLEIARQHQELELTHREITDSIAYAKRIQSAILPTEEMLQQKLSDFFVLYMPKDVVAGDFYWMENLDKDNFLLAVADCTGHGVPGAMVSVVCNNALNRAVREFGLTKPGDILDKTRDLVVEEFSSTKHEVKDGMDIALCHIQKTERGMNIQFSGAHNPIWIIRSGSSEIEEYKGNKQPVGVFENVRPFDTQTIELHKGDTFFLSSDGFADQFGGDKGKKMKTTNFKRLLSSLSGLSLVEMHEHLEADFETWKGGFEQLDDICVIGVRIE